MSKRISLGEQIDQLQEIVVGIEREPRRLEASEALQWRHATVKAAIVSLGELAALLRRLRELGERVGE